MFTKIETKTTFILSFLIGLVLINTINASDKIVNIQKIKNITCEQALDTINNNKSNKDLIIIDFRPESMFLDSHIKGAIFHDVFAADIDEWLRSLDKTKVYLIYCTIGHRSGIAFEKMKTMNFENIFHMDGGINRWCNLGFNTSSGIAKSTITLIKDQKVRSNTKNRFAIVTYVNDNTQERSARAFIKSVRERAGKYNNSKIYIVLGDQENFPCESLIGENIILLPLKMDPEFRNFPLAIKAFVAAQVEKLVKDEVTTLAWFDPATLALNSLNELDLHDKFGAAIRPVSLLNTIGIQPGSQPNEYWAPIYSELDINYKEVPAYQTVVDEKPIQAYFNCEIFSVDPRLGIFSEWANVFTKLLKDDDYQENVCNTFLKRLFLHQAVLSGVIISKIDSINIKPLSIKSGYPFGQHDRLSDKKKIKKLNNLSAIIFDYTWEQNGRWMEKISIEEPLKDWLTETYIEYCKLTENLYRIEGQCNSYLIVTSEGSVLIDPAGAADAPKYFKRILEKHPVKSILLTHAHQDHWNNIDIWIEDPNILIIAQEGFNDYNEYRKRLLPFYARRGSVYRSNAMSDTTEIPPFNPVKPTIIFDNDYTYELGGFHFKMVHTPGETPDHATIWIPELGAVFMGDNYYKYFINNATLRGTSPRPILGYINALDLALAYKPDYFLMGHGKPLVAKNIIKTTITNFRDALQYLHDETIKGINDGKDIYSLMQEIKVPAKYEISPYFGTVEWTIRGIYDENIGWFDENPASMYSLPTSSIYKDLIEISSIDKYIKKAEKFIERKEYVKVLHLTDIFLSSFPNDQPMNEIRIKALEGLKSATYNYQKRIWLDHGIRISKNRLEE